MPVSTKPFALYVEHMLGAHPDLASGRNETQRDLCRAYLASGERLLNKGKMVELAYESLHVLEEIGDSAAIEIGALLQTWEASIR